MSKGVEIISYYYDDYENALFDQDGNVFCDIFRLIPPWKFNKYRRDHGTYYIKHKTREDIMYELVFPWYGDEEEEEDGIHYYG